MQVPDVSAVLHTSDFPCVKANASVPDTEWRDKKQVHLCFREACRPIKFLLFCDTLLSASCEMDKGARPLGLCAALLTLQRNSMLCL